MEDARAILKKLQTPIQRNVSRCGFFGVVFGLFLMFIGLLFLVILLCWPETLQYWERNKCFAMRSDLSPEYIDSYVKERMKAVVIDVRDIDLTNETVLRDFSQLYKKASTNKLDVYVSLSPENSSVINNELRGFSLNGVFVDRNEIREPNNLLTAFNAVNEYKVKVNPNFSFGLLTNFKEIVDRYYFDYGVFNVFSNNKKEVLNLVQYEMKKGKVLIQLDISFFGSIDNVFDMANYIDTFCDSDLNFVGYIVNFG